MAKKINEERQEGKAESLFRDFRLAYYLLDGYKNTLETQELYYLKKYRDSGCILCNERAKADYVRQKINTIEDWLDRNRAYKTTSNDVLSMDEDYNRLDTLKIK